MLGADLFVRTLLREVKPVADINLEARGTSGPSLMFETGPKNASLIHAYANSAPFPHAASYFTTMYALGPNHTDYTVFKKAGVPGLNFAFIEQSENYHRMTDDFAHLDARSVEGQGRTALAVAESLADATDLSIATGNSVFLDLLHQTVLRWPATATWPVTLFLWLPFAYSGWKVLRNRASWKGGHKRERTNSCNLW